MTPIQFLLEHREKVLDAYDGSPVEAWRKLVDRVQIDKAMSENTFRTVLKPFAETCNFFNDGLNKLNTDNGLNVRLDEMAELNKQLNEELNNKRELNSGLNYQVQELNDKLNTFQELNAELNNELVKFRLNASDGVELNKSNERLNTVGEQVKSKLNIAGWTVAHSGRYYRAFKKIKGKVHGVHLGKSLDEAEAKIQAKQKQLAGGEH